MHFAVFLGLLASCAFAGQINEKANVDLLKMDLAKLKDVEKASSSNWISFGRKSSDIILDSEILKGFIENSNTYNEKTFTTTANLKTFDKSGKSTLISFQSMLTSKRYFEVYIRETGDIEQHIEGSKQGDAREKKHFSLGLTYISKQRQVDHLVPLEGRFRPGQWFTLMVRVIGNSHVEISFDCELIQRTKLQEHMEEIPIYVEARLAQSASEDFWTFRKLIANRFIGDIKESKFIFGKAAFDSLNPCKDYRHPGLVIEGTKRKQPEKLEMRPLTIESLLGSGPSICIIGMKMIEHGEQWMEGPCRVCHCQHGNVSCSHQEPCSATLIP